MFKIFERVPWAFEVFETEIGQLEHQRSQDHFGLLVLSL